jgi:hypothetical protein
MLSDCGPHLYNGEVTQPRNVSHMLTIASVIAQTREYTRGKICLTRRMVSSGMLRRVALIKTDVSEEPRPSFIRVTRIGELGTTLAATISSQRASVVSCS